MKINLGCGDDYRDGFINIDASPFIKSDKCINTTQESLLNHFASESAELILAYDILEHHYRFEALKLLREFYEILKIDGQLDIRCPDVEIIIASEVDTLTKIQLLFGGQDIKNNNQFYDQSREHHPELFCHKYGWTKTTLTNELRQIGFKQIHAVNSGSNMVITAMKANDIRFF